MATVKKEESSKTEEPIPNCVVHYWEKASKILADIKNTQSVDTSCLTIDDLLIKNFFEMLLIKRYRDAHAIKQREEMEKTIRKANAITKQLLKL